MRIAIFSETFLPKWDGVANTVCHLLEHLERRGHETLMWAPEGAPASWASTPILPLPAFPCPWYPPLKLVMPQKDQAAELADFRPDVVHLVNPALLGLLGLRRARQVGAPVVASYHTDIPGYMERYGLSLMRDPMWAYFRWVHNQADLNVCPSTSTRDELLEHGFERVEIWSRGVDNEKFHPRHRSAAWRERLTGGEPHKILLLYVGRLAPEKHVHLLRPVLDALPGVRLAVVGDGPERGRLAGLFDGTPTVFTGRLSGSELSAAYASGDVFVFPAENDTFGNVVLEAQASGLPAVVARIGGPIDQVVDGHNGFCFTPGDTAELTHRVRWLVRDGETRRRMAAAARAFAEARTWEAIHDGLIDQYERVAAAAAAPLRATA